MALSFSLYLRKHKINKSFMYRVGFVLILALMPFLAKADSSSALAGANAAPIDPIKAGEFARTINARFPETFYIDPDFVVLNEMQKGDYTLAQKLAINEGKSIGPDRPAPIYEFKDGDTIESVADKFNLHAGSILDASHIRWEDARTIKTGSTLSIPTSDTNTSDDWRTVLDRAEAQKKDEEAQKAKAQTRRTVIAREASTIRQAQYNSGSGATVIGSSYEQCVPWARENSGIGIQGYAGNIQPNAYEPRVGSIALDAFVGHASVVVSIGDDYIVVHEANWIRGKMTERTVSKAAIRGYVY